MKCQIQKTQIWKDTFKKLYWLEGELQRFILLCKDYGSSTVFWISRNKDQSEIGELFVAWKAICMRTDWKCWTALLSIGESNKRDYDRSLQIRLFVLFTTGLNCSDYSSVLIEYPPQFGSRRRFLLALAPSALSLLQAKCINCPMQ